MPVMNMPFTRKPSREARHDKGLDPSANPVVEAIKAGDAGQLTILITQGASVSAGDAHGTTPLMYAASLGRLGCLQLLIDKGADVNAVKGDGFTPLIYAAQGGHGECARSLVGRGARLDAKSSGGSTCLHFAIRKGHIDCVDTLIQLGANVDALNGDGLDALAYAQKHGKSEIVKFLTTGERPLPDPIQPTASPGTIEATKFELVNSHPTSGASASSSQIRAGSQLPIRSTGKYYSYNIDEKIKWWMYLLPLGCGFIGIIVILVCAIKGVFAMKRGQADPAKRWKVYCLLIWGAVFAAIQVSIIIANTANN